MPPGATHWLGTDDVGRDIFSRLIFGAPASLFGSLFAVGIAIAIGLPVGLFSGYVGGWIDDVIRRIIDTLLSFPAIVLAIGVTRSEEHTSELQSLMRISYAVLCLKQKNNKPNNTTIHFIISSHTI